MIMNKNILLAMDGSRSFLFDGHAVRAGEHGSNPWCCVIDILKALDNRPYPGKKYHVTEALKGLDADEWILNALPDAEGVMQPTACVFESGLYFLIGKSRKPSAKKFQAWVRKEVLPAINKTGTYTVPTAAPAITNDNVLELLEAMIQEIRSKDVRIQDQKRLVDASVQALD